MCLALGSDSKAAVSKALALAVLKEKVMASYVKSRKWMAERAHVTLGARRRKVWFLCSLITTDVINNCSSSR